MVKPQTVQKIRYVTPPRRRKVEVLVEATSPIATYIVQASDFKDWKDGDDYGGTSFPRRKKLHAKLTFTKDFEDEWYLVFENTSDDDIGVHYEVYGYKEFLSSI